MATQQRPPEQSAQDNSLRQVIEDSRRQSNALLAQINQQRIDAEAATQRRQQELAAEQAAQANRAANVVQQGSYATLSEAPVENLQTTQQAKPKPKDMLRLSSPGRSASGAGLNLGT